MLLLDTCALVRDALSPRDLSAAAVKLMNEAEDEGVLACCDISLWEVAMLVQHGRLSGVPDVAVFLDLVLKARRIRVLPISVEVAARAVALPLHKDPADRLIVACALTHAATVVTRDERIRGCGLVPTIW